MFDYPSLNTEEITLIWTMVGLAEDNYTFVKGFDITDNGSGTFRGQRKSTAAGTSYRLSTGYCCSNSKW